VLPGQAPYGAAIRTCHEPGPTAAQFHHPPRRPGAAAAAAGDCRRSSKPGGRRRARAGTGRQSPQGGRPAPAPHSPAHLSAGPGPGLRTHRPHPRRGEWGDGGPAPRLRRDGGGGLTPGGHRQPSDPGDRPRQGGLQHRCDVHRGREGRRHQPPPGAPRHLHRVGALRGAQGQCPLRLRRHGYLPPSGN